MMTKYSWRRFLLAVGITIIIIFLPYFIETSVFHKADKDNLMFIKWALGIAEMAGTAVILVVIIGVGFFLFRFFRSVVLWIETGNWEDVFE